MKPDKVQSLDRILESVVIMGWSDLMKDTKVGSASPGIRIRTRQLLGVLEALVVHSPRALASRVRIPDVSFRLTPERHLLRGWVSI